MSLTERVENAYIRLVGNRVTLAASLLVAGTVYLNIQSMRDDDFNWVQAFTPMMYITGALTLANTKCGGGTLYFYRRTEKSIQKRGYLKPRVIELWMTHKTENREKVGYCQQQGMYLAARKYDQLEAFYAAKKKVSNVKIPHF